MRAEVDGGQRGPGDRGERAVVHPDERDVAGHVEPGAVERGKRPDREQVVGTQDRVRAGAGQQPLGGASARLDHEVRRRSRAAPRPGRCRRARRPSSVSEPSLRAGNRSARAVDERDPPTTEAWRWRTASAAPLREWARTTSTESSTVGRPITTTGTAAPRSSSAWPAVSCSEARISPSTKRCRRSRDDRELVLGVGAGRVEQEPPAAGAGDLLDRADHGHVDGVADVGDREGDLPGAPRAQRARCRIRHEAHRLGRLGHPVRACSGSSGSRSGRAKPMRPRRSRGARPS